MIQRRRASQARPKMPAWSTGSSTTSGTSSTEAPAAVETLMVPTRWPLASGRDQRVGALDLGLELGALALGHADEQAAGRAQLGFGRLALPDRHGRDRLVVVEQADVVEGLEGPVQQHLALAGARLHRGGVEHHGQDPALARALAVGAQVREFALRGRDQAIPGRIGVAGLEAVDAGVAAQQQVAVRLVDVVVAVFLDRVVGEELGVVANDVGRDHGQVARRALVAGFGQAGGVLERGVLQAEGLRLAVHHADELVERAADRLGQRHRGVVAGLHDLALEEFLDGRGHGGVDEHQRTAGLALVPGPLGDRQALLQRELLVVDRGEDHVQAHQLGQRGRIGRDVGVALGQGLVAGQVEHQEALGVDLGGLRCLRVRGDREGQ